MVGGAIWRLALSFNVIASSVAGPAISYALGQGATLVAALWGLLIWREFRAAPQGTNKYLGLMMGVYTLGLIRMGAASQKPPPAKRRAARAPCTQAARLVCCYRIGL